MYTGGVRLVNLAGPMVALALLAGAQAVGDVANTRRAATARRSNEPYAPSPGAARIASLGYREAVADLLWVRALVAFGSETDPGARSIRGLVEAIAALDPTFEEPMEWGALAMQSITMTLTQDDYLQALRVLEAAMARFPQNYHLPQRAGEIYVLRLRSDDPAQVRAWKAKGAALLASAARLPDAPKSLGSWVAVLQTELGQRDQAIRDLRELILYTTDRTSRDRLLRRLAALTRSSTESLRYELDVEGARFTDAWRRDRPELPATAYVLVGPPPSPWFDPATLADDPDVPVVEPIPPLPPLADDLGELTTP